MQSICRGQCDITLGCELGGKSALKNDTHAVFCLSDVKYCKIPCHVSQGKIYDSATMSGYTSRPLREDEFHRQAVELGCAFSCNIKWTTIPTMVLTDDSDEDDDEKLELSPWPVLFPSSIVT